MLGRTSRPVDACPDSRLLADLAAARVWPWQRRRLISHLPTCPHCAAELQSLLAIQDGLHDALGVTRPSDRTRLGWTAAFATAGACAAALAVVLLLAGQHPVPDPTGPASDLLFASSFADGAVRAADDTLFRGDFDGDIGNRRPDTLFKSDFGSES